MTKFNVYIMNKKLLPSLYLAIDSDLSQEVLYLATLVIFF